jgi:nucleotide-binding universal stress UspA family protein
MLKTILVPLDGSERAEYVLPLVARLASHTNGTIVLVRVVNIVTTYWPAVPYPLMMQSAVDGELKEATAYLERIAALALLSGIEVTYTARHGVIAPVILAAAAEYHADLIVMCSHRRSGVAHAIIGSVAEKIVRHASIPILIIDEKEELPQVSPAATSQPLHALVPLDGSAHAEAALEPAAELLTALSEPAQKVTISLVRVVEPATGQQEELHVAYKALSRVEPYLDHTIESIQEGTLAPQISQQHIGVNWLVALDTDVARGIVRMAETGADAEGTDILGGGSQLIAMSTHGRGGLQRLTMGSVTERVLHSTKRPILVVRPPEEVHK